MENSLRKHGGDMYEKDTIEVRQCYSGGECFYTALYMLAQVFKYELPETGCKRVVVKGPKHEIFVAEFFTQSKPDLGTRKSIYLFLMFGALYFKFLSATNFFRPTATAP